MYKFEDLALWESWIKSYKQPKSTNPLTSCTYGQLVDHLNHSKQNKRSTIGKPTRVTYVLWHSKEGTNGPKLQHEKTLRIFEPSYCTSLVRYTIYIYCIEKIKETVKKTIITWRQVTSILPWMGWLVFKKFSIKDNPEGNRLRLVTALGAVTYGLTTLGWFF